MSQQLLGPKSRVKFSEDTIIIWSNEQAKILFLQERLYTTYSQMADTREKTGT